VEKNYKQVFGTAMCSPVSSVVANLITENVETSALETFADPRVCGKDMSTTLL